LINEFVHPFKLLSDWSVPTCVRVVVPTMYIPDVLLRQVTPVQWGTRIRSRFSCCPEFSGTFLHETVGSRKRKVEYFSISLHS